MVQEAYLIDHRTMFLAPGRNIHYECKAVTVDGMTRVKMPALKIIDDSCCQYNFAHHHSVRKFIAKHFKYYRKAPIPLGFNCLFPTHRITDLDCHWISVVHLQGAYRLDEGRRTKLVFKNGYELALDVSIKSIRNQIKRAKVILDRKQSSYDDMLTKTSLKYLLIERMMHDTWGKRKNVI